MSETNQENQKELNEDFPYQAFNMDGKLVLKNLKTEKIIELDFDAPQIDSSEDSIFKRKKEKEEAKVKEKKEKSMAISEAQKRTQKAKNPNLEQSRKYDTEEEFENNKNLTKNDKKNIKNKIKKSEDTMDKDEKNETETKKETEKDLTGDSKKVIDGQEVNTPAEGDDYEAGDKVRGDPYNETEHYVKKKDMEDMIKKITADVISSALEGKLSAFEEKLNKDLAPIKEKQKLEDEAEKQDLLDALIDAPYDLNLEDIKDMSLEELKDKKANFDMLPLIRDFIQENKPLTHRDIKKNAFDMNEPQPYDLKSNVFKSAQNDFISDLGEEKYKRDFGGVN